VICPHTPSGSRRILEVTPSTYSPALRPSVDRQAPAKKRTTSMLARDFLVARDGPRLSGVADFEIGQLVDATACIEPVAGSISSRGRQ
jgi:hypothetical protein